MITHPSLAAAIIDVALPDGSGLSVLRRLREQYREIPTLVMTGSARIQIASSAHLLDAAFLPKPIATENIEHFLSGIEIARSHNTPPRSSCDEAKRRSELAGYLAISENTLKTQIRSLLLRAGESILDAVERRVLARAFAVTRRR